MSDEFCSANVRKISEDNLNESNLALEIALENAKIGSGMLLIHDGITEIFPDQRMCDVTGVSLDLPPIKRHEFIMNNYDSSALKDIESFFKKMISGESAEVEALYHHPTKGTRYIRCIGKKLYGSVEEGKICLHGCFQDITDFYSEKIRKEEDALFSKLLLQDYVNIYVVNPDDETIEVRKQDGFAVVNAENGSFEKFPYDLAWKKYIKSCVHPADSFDLYQAGKLEKVLEVLKEQSEYTFNYRTVNNGLRYYQFKYMPLGDGRILAGFRNIDDLIKEEKEKARVMRENLVNELEEYDRIIVTLGKEYSNIYSININTYIMHVLKQNGYHAVDALDGSNVEGFEWNKEWERYVNTLVHEEDRGYVLKAGKVENVIAKLKEMEQYSKSYRTVRDGKTVYYQFRFVMFDEDTIIACFRDVNDLINREFEHRRIVAESEAVKEALEKAEGANRAKTVFLNNMSHDIRTPMNAIIGFTNLANENIGNDEKIENYLAKIRTSSTHLLSLINDVLDMSRIESGKVTIQEKEESLSEIIHDIKNIVFADAKKKQLSLFFDIINVKDELIICDKLRLRQVLINCLNNAIKFTPEYGTVVLRVAQKTCNISNHALYEFMIIDTGIGMDKEFIEHIYEPFSRENTLYNGSIQGTGLGMSITKSIVDMMHGDVKVESEKNVGTKIRISIDFEKSAAKDENLHMLKFDSQRALVVDVNSDSCDNLVSMLNETGLNTDWSMSLEESIKKLRAAKENNLPYQVYLVDELTDSFGGMEVIRKLRQEVGEEPKIILLTSTDIPEAMSYAKESGATQLCEKPIFMSNLYNVLTQTIKGNIEVETKTENNYSLNGIRFLLVEDNELNRELAEENLLNYGAKVDTAENGLIALEKMRNAQEDTYDIILMDIQMPVMNGYESASAIRKLPNAKVAATPIIALSANAFEEDKVKSIECGMNEHVAKPIDVDVLMTTISSILKK